jgi:uncharacterized integral membrane protein
MLFMIVLSVLLLDVAIFALENAQAVTVRFLSWQLQSSVAIVTLAAAAAGALVIGLAGLASRLRRWKRGRATPGAERLETVPSAARAPTGPSTAGEIDGAHGIRIGEQGSARFVDKRKE